MPSFKFNNKIGKFNELILKQYEGDESRHYKAKLNVWIYLIIEPYFFFTYLITELTNF